MNFSKYIPTLAAAFVTFVGHQSPAMAQATSKVLLEEVQVFGSKQASSQAAQDVPLQISAYDSTQLETLKVVTLEDLSFSMPNVSLDQIGTFPGVANFSIRGFGINSSAASIDPAVGLFIDGVYMGVNFGSVVDTFDLESVEVLRGPQGVLFGRNVTGGAVLLRTARPTPGEDLKAKIKVGYETEDQLTVSSSVEGSLTDAIAAKLAVYNRDDGGYFDNSFLNKDIGAQESQLIKFTTVWQPTNSLDFTLVYEDGSMEGDGAVLQFANYKPLDPSDKVQTKQGTIGENDQKWERLMLEANWDIGPGRLTNIFGMRDLDVYMISDIDGAQADSIEVEQGHEHKQFSNELRYNFSATDNWNVTLGVYWFEADLESYGGRWMRLFSDDDTQRPLLRGAGGGRQTHVVKGLFWNNEIELTETLDLTLGVRYTEEEKKDVAVYPLSFSGDSPCDTNTATCDDVGPYQSMDWSNTTPKIGLQWSPSDDAQLYAYYTKGFRSGGFDNRADPQYAGIPYDEENTDSYEVGLKSVFLDGTVRFNAALFYNEVADIQRTSFFEGSEGAPAQLTQNVADATVTGAEIDFSALLSENFVLTFNAGYLDASYDEIFTSFDPALPLEDQEDLEFARAPELTFSTSVNYDFAIADHGFLSSRLAYSYRDSTFYDDRNRGKFPSYSLVDVGFTYAPNDGVWSLSLYGKNLLDTAVLGSIVSFPPAFYPGPDGNYTAGLGKGRRWGLEFAYHFE